MKTLGPMPIYFATKLQQMLEEKDRLAEVVPSPSSIESYQKSIENNIRLYPTATAWSDLVLLRMSPGDFEIVREEAEKMLIAQDENFEEPESVSEYLCPRCEHRSLSQGHCPEHEVPLLEFSEWVSRNTGRRRKLDKFEFFMCAGFFLAITMVWALFTYSA